ncbi:MAG: caprolactamase subunit alpha [Geminicoccaceae bacterium]
MRSEFRLGVDAGGTFTDFVLADRKGDVKLYKALSTPDDPTIALQNGLDLIAEDLGCSPGDIVSSCDLCINGTTVGLNALIQHKGAKTGLICTAGHEDSIEIRLGHKEDGYRYDATYPPAVMLVPRYLRCGIRERVISTGAVYTPMQEKDVAAACKLFKKEGVESVAISFVWSVLNPEHERRAAAIVREMMPDALLTIGAELYPQVREYTRTSTAITNAYLGPTLKRYVDAIDRYFSELGARYPVRYFQSNGGLALGEVMTDRSVYAINSGPASAPQAGLHVTAPFGHEDVITIDMGGTSFDITLTKDGSTNVNKNIDFLRYRIGVPMIQVETLGAGGGSIAWIDDYGLLQVGPQSAGADPGPACYGRGGELPTVTDANLVLGYLNPDHLLGGRMKVHRGHAERAVRDNIADPLDLTLEQAAIGIITIVNANMANGIRRVSVERGFDPRDFVLVAAGGAGALHVTALAREMGISSVVVPKLASGLCAFGQLISNVKYSAMAACPLRLDEKADVDHLNGLYANIEKEAITNLKSDGFTDRTIEIHRSMDMRYVGQVHECTVDIGNFKITKKTFPDIIDAFHKRHEQLFTYSEPHNVVEIVNLESTVYGIVDKPPERKLADADGDPSRAMIGERAVIFDGSGKHIKGKVYDGEALGAGDQIEGPGIIEEATTTIVIEPGWRCALEPSGAYRLTST